MWKYNTWRRRWHAGELDDSRWLSLVIEIRNKLRKQNRDFDWYKYHALHSLFPPVISVVVPPPCPIASQRTQSNVAYILTGSEPSCADIWRPTRAQTASALLAEDHDGYGRLGQQGRCQYSEHLSLMPCNFSASDGRRNR